MLSDDDVRRRLRDIRHNIDLAAQFTAGTQEAAFEADTLLVYAVTRCLEIVSEASRHLPADIRERRPEIPWRQMADAGNIYRHAYEDVAPPQLWSTLTDHLPPLRTVVEAELALLDLRP